MGLAPEQELARQLKSRLRVCVIGPDGGIRQILDTNLPGLVTKDNNIEAVLWITGLDHMGQSQRNLFRGRNAILIIENHGVQEIEH